MGLLSGACRSGCLLISLIALIPSLLLALVVGVGLAQIGILPAPAAEAVGNVERLVAQSAMATTLGHDDITVRSVSLANAKDHTTTLTVDLGVAHKSDAADAVVRRALAEVGGRLDTPFGFGRGIDRFVVHLFVGSAAKPLTITVPRAALDAWRRGSLSDAAFSRGWTRS